MRPLLVATLTLARLLPRLLGVRLAAGLLPGVTVLVFIFVPLLPVMDWGALRVALSAAEPSRGAAAALVPLCAAALGARRTLRAILHGEALRFLDRLPIPAVAWGPGLAALLLEITVPLALLSWFWESPRPLMQGLVFAGVALPLLVAAAGAGGRAAGYGLAVAGVGFGALSLARAAPWSLPALGPLCLGSGALVSGWIHGDLRLRSSGFTLAIPGRPRSAVGAWLRWDLTLVSREEPRALLWALGAGPCVGLSAGAFAHNAGLSGTGASAVALIFLALFGVPGLLPLIRALDLQDGRPGPSAAPMQARDRVPALVILGMLGLGPGGLGAATVLARLHPPGLLSLLGLMGAVPALLVWTAARPDPARAHRINPGWAAGALALGAAVAVALPVLGIAVLFASALLFSWRARLRLDAAWGRLGP